MLVGGNGRTVAAGAASKLDQINGTLPPGMTRLTVTPRHGARASRLESALSLRGSGGSESLMLILRGCSIEENGGAEQWQ